MQGRKRLLKPSVAGSGKGEEASEYGVGMRQEPGSGRRCVQRSVGLAESKFVGSERAKGSGPSFLGSAITSFNLERPLSKLQDLKCCNDTQFSKRSDTSALVWGEVTSARLQMRPLQRELSRHARRMMLVRAASAGQPSGPIPRAEEFRWSGRATRRSQTVPKRMPGSHQVGWLIWLSGEAGELVPAHLSFSKPSRAGELCMVVRLQATRQYTAELPSVSTRPSFYIFPCHLSRCQPLGVSREHAGSSDVALYKLNEGQLRQSALSPGSPL